mmetsp:Transcript_88009/g.128678  ORF Transcript_88009/g.128678 Transcript_88009/m.128678 type:complete len:228 (+) Transcript_88009:128-811(+)
MSSRPRATRCPTACRLVSCGPILALALLAVMRNASSFSRMLSTPSSRAGTASIQPPRRTSQTSTTIRSSSRRSSKRRSRIMSSRRASAQHATSRDSPCRLAPARRTAWLSKKCSRRRLACFLTTSRAPTFPSASCTARRRRSCRQVGFFSRSLVPCSFLVRRALGVTGPRAVAFSTIPTRRCCAGAMRRTSAASLRWRTAVTSRVCLRASASCPTPSKRRPRGRARS